MISRNQCVKTKNKMRNTEKQNLTGISSSNLLGGLSLLQTYISIGELLNSLPQENLLERFVTNYERSANKESLRKLEEYYLKSLVDNTTTDMAQITICAYDSVRCEKVSDNLVTLKFSQHKSVVLDGFLQISAFSNLLDRVDPFTQKDASRKILSDMQKYALASLDVRLSIFYRNDGKINDELLSKLFIDINSIETKVYSQYISTHDEESPLYVGAEKLAQALNLDEIGGVSELNKLTKSDSFVTTKSTLTHILLASVGGKGARIGKRLPTHLPSKAPITKHLIDEALQTVVPLLSGWVSCLESQFKQDKSGFQNSMQIWQALGLVAHHLMQHAVLSESEIYSAGQRLGQLDYSKDAAHWKECKAFKKDLNDRYWINATGGGRTLRDKVAEYFICVLSYV